MRQIILLCLLALLLTNISFGQQSGPLRIDSIFIENEIIIPNPNDTIQTISDTISTDYLMDFRGVSSLDSSQTDVYWRVLFDGDDDGNFTEIYEIGPIPPGATPDTVLQLTEFLMLPFGTVRKLRVEFTDNRENFNRNSNYIDVYRQINIILKSNTGGRVAVGNKSNDGTGRFGDTICFPYRYLGLKDGILEFFIYNIEDSYGLVCDADNISLVSIHIYGYDDQLLCESTNIENFSSLTSYNSGVQVFPNYVPFELNTGKRARVEVNIGAFMSSVCPSFMIEQIRYLEIFVSQAGCPISPIPTIFCLGCRDDVLYFAHTTLPPTNGLLEHLPPFTKASNSIKLSDSVTVVSGDDVELVVNNSGYIHARASIQVEPGAYFWAHKEDVCLPPDNTISYSESIQTQISTSQSGIQIFPNPFQSSFTVELKLEEAAIVTIALFDMLGRQREVLQPIDYSHKTTTRIEVPTAGLSAGLYYCQIRIGEEVYTKSIVKVE